MRRRLAWLVLAAAAAVTLAGCMRFNADMTVKTDNTVDGSYVIAIEKGSGAAMGGSDQSVAQGLYTDSGLQTHFERSWTHPYAQDGFAGVEVQFRDEPLATFAPTNDRFGIVRQGDEFVVSGKASSTEAEKAADASDTPDMSVTIAFPGKVTSANGEIHGNTVTWNLVGGPPTLEARASAIPVHSPWPAMVATVGVLAFAALTFWPRATHRSNTNPKSRTNGASKPRSKGQPEQAPVRRPGAPMPK